MQKFVQHVLFTVTAALLILAACETTTGPQFTETDYSTVPEAYDTTDAEKVTMEDGLVYYIIEEGSGSATLESRDAVALFITIRLTDETIILSTYANGRTSPQSEQVSNFGTAGFRRGVLGMKNSGKRVIVVPPDLGYGNTPPGSANYQLRNDTLIYDIEIDEILIGE